MRGKRAKALRAAATALLADMKEIASDAAYNYKTHYRRQILFDGMGLPFYDADGNIKTEVVPRYIATLPENSLKGQYRKQKREFKRRNI